MNDTIQHVDTWPPGKQVRIVNHPHRAGQYGEISQLPAPSGLIYVRVAPIGERLSGFDASRDKVTAIAALRAMRHGALAAVEEHQLEAA